MPKLKRKDFEKDFESLRQGFQNRLDRGEPVWGNVVSLTERDSDFKGIVPWVVKGYLQRFLDTSILPSNADTVDMAWAFYRCEADLLWDVIDAGTYTPPKLLSKMNQRELRQTYFELFLARANRFLFVLATEPLTDEEKRETKAFGMGDMRYAETMLARIRLEDQSPRMIRLQHYPAARDMYLLIEGCSDNGGAGRGEIKKELGMTEASYKNAIGRLELLGCVRRLDVRPRMSDPARPGNPGRPELRYVVTEGGNEG